jgi:methanogenic corrinoid protein MtbC1
MTAYRYVRTGRLPAVRGSDGEWRIESADLERLRRGQAPHSGSGPASLAPSHARLKSRMLEGDETGAWTLVEAALASGMEPEIVLLEFVSPVLRDIGEGWADGELSVADEHLASAVASRLVSRLGGRFGRRGRKRGRVVLVAAPGDLHSTPIAIAADLLRWRGFEVLELGANTPVEALVRTLSTHDEVLAVAVACSTDLAVRTVGKAIAAIRLAAPDLPVLLGGATVTSAEQARKLGADRYTGATSDELARILEALVEARQ